MWNLLFMFIMCSINGRCFKCLITTTTTLLILVDSLLSGQEDIIILILQVKNLDIRICLRFSCMWCNVHSDFHHSFLVFGQTVAWETMPRCWDLSDLKMCNHLSCAFDATTTTDCCTDFMSSRYWACATTSWPFVQKVSPNAKSQSYKAAKNIHSLQHLVVTLASFFHLKQSLCNTCFFFSLLSRLLLEINC